MRANLTVIGCLTLCQLSFLANVDAQAFQMRIGNTFGYPGQLVEIPILITTQEDCLNGFQISITLSQMELMYFEVDTVVVDSDTSFVCDFDTGGTLTSDWEWMAARSTAGKGFDIRLSGISSIGPPHIPGIPDHIGGTLMRIYGRIRDDVSDTLTDRTVYLIVAEGATHYTNENGEPIYPVENFDGSVIVGICDCNVWRDVSGDGNVNPVDVVYIVNYVYLMNDMRIQPPACPYEAGDVNCDGAVNPVDVVLFVNRIYLDIDMFCGDPCGE